MPGTIGGLAAIHSVSGVSIDDQQAFVTLRAEAETGDVLVGQLSPAECRGLALQLLESAEAAEQDRIVFVMLTRDVGVDEQTAAGFISSMRRERDA